MKSTPQNPVKSYELVVRRLARRVGLSRWYLAAERFAQVFWPAWTVALLGVTVVWFGLFSRVSAEVAYTILGALAFAFLIAAFLGGWRFRVPSRAEASARIDDATGYRPVTALLDEQATGTRDAAAQALWHRHMQDMARHADAAKVPPPDLRLASRDPFGLRLIVLSGFAAAILFATGGKLGEIATGGSDASGQIATGPSFEVWASPPLHTGKPVVYLGDVASDERVLLPEGTEITVRYYGPVESFAIVESVGEGEVVLPSQSADGVVDAVWVARHTGTVTLLEGGDEVAAWTLDISADLPPEIELLEDLSRTPEGAMELKYAASDDYGVAHAQVSIELARDQLPDAFGFRVEPIPRVPIVLDLPLPFSGGLTDIEEVMVEDLARHPWAGLPVRVTLTATDQAGQSGIWGPELMDMPGRRFFDPLAGSIAEQRRDLLWSPQNALRVDQIIRAITHRPSENFKSSKAYLVVRTALRRLGYALEDSLTADEVDDISEFLWRAALLIEEGDLSSALERLRQAQDRLEDAIRNGATGEEIAELMQELEEATDEYMRQLARQAMENGEQQQAGNQQQGQTIDQDVLEEMRREIERLMQEGRTEEARRLLDEYRRMMENMQMALREGQGQNGQQGQGQQTMQDLQETLRQQQDLSDESFRELQRQFQRQRQQGQQNQQGQQGQQEQQGQQGQQGEGSQQGQQREGGQTQPGGSGESGRQQGQQQSQGQGAGGLTGEELARRQEALRRMLDDLRGQIPQFGGQAPGPQEDLDRAEREMGEARDNLDQGDLPGALDNQADAMEALRGAIDALGEQLREQAMQQGQQGGQDGQFSNGPNSPGIDPLGRPLGANGRLNSDQNLLPGEDQIRRSRELLDEIRRRSSDKSRPALELDYLRRLLERF